MTTAAPTTSSPLWQIKRLSPTSQGWGLPRRLTDRLAETDPTQNGAHLKPVTLDAATRAELAAYAVGGTQQRPPEV